MNSLDWAPVENCLRKAIESVEHDVLRSGSRKQFMLVKEALYHGEYGLALEDLTAILSEERIAVPKEVYAALERAGTLMNEAGAELDERHWQQFRDQSF